MKKFIAIALLCTMLMQLVSCANSGVETEKPVDSDSTQADTTTEAPPETEPVIEKRFDIDWDGRVFHILGIKTDYEPFSNFEVYAEEYNSEPINDAVYDRNKKIEKMYGVKFQYDTDPDNDNGDEFIRQIVMTNDDSWDLSFARTNIIGKVAAEGMFANLYDMDYIDFSQPWWNQKANDTLTISNKLFFTTSDFLLHDKKRSYIIIYNATMADAYQMDDLQTIAEEGKWTIDLMDTLSRVVASDVNNDNQMNEEDIFGVNGGAHKDVAMFAFSMGNKIVSKDESGQLYISMKTERLENSIDKILSVYDRKISSFPEDLQTFANGDFWMYAENIFFKGNALFRATEVGALSGCAQYCEFDYKVLPMPKYDENQENYITQPDDITLLFNVPRTASNIDFSGFMLEVLSEESSKTTLPLYYDTICQKRLAPDPRSANLLKIALDGIDYDIGFIYNLGELRDILAITIPTRRKNVLSTYYKKNATRATEAIQQLIDDFAKLN